MREIENKEKADKRNKNGKENKGILILYWPQS